VAFYVLKYSIPFSKGNSSNRTVLFVGKRNIALMNGKSNHRELKKFTYFFRSMKFQIMKTILSYLNWHFNNWREKCKSKNICADFSILQCYISFFKLPYNSRFYIRGKFLAFA
jgi:hypothetical protein